MRTIKNLLSCCALLLFFIMGVSSAVSGPRISFDYSKRTEGEPINQSFLVKNDGSRVFGKDVFWKAGFLTKDQIRINNETFKIKDIKGYFQNGIYYGRFRGVYVQRVVHGKINVYITYREVTETHTDHGGFTHTSSRMITEFYYQKGEDGQFVSLPDMNAVRKLVEDCPAAEQMLDMSKSKLRKTIRKQRDYLNTVFEVYNNGCNPVHERSTE